MTKTPQDRRCSECNRPFVPDPRVRSRQVTCGEPECQQLRHAGQCRDWHRENRGKLGSHYRDVVVPFRQRHPSYQRRWRLGQRLREIREEIAELAHRMQRRVSAALGWAQALGLQTGQQAQEAEIPAESLDARVASASQLGQLLEQVAALTGQVEARPS